MKHDLVIRNGLVLTPDGAQAIDVAINGKGIAAVGGSFDGAEEVDADGAWVGPGLVDLHAHFREPGQEWKEDIRSGSEAAAAGGYTAVVAMPNTRPAVDSGHIARLIRDRSRQVGLCDVIPAGAITMGREGAQLAHLDELWEAGVRVFTDDGDSVSDSGLLRVAMEYLAERGAVVAQHAEDRSLAAGGHMHEGTLSARLGMKGIPAEAEEVVVGRDLALTRLTGCRYHVQHVSSARTIPLLSKAKADGLPVTAEVTPHHLTFDDAAAGSLDPAFKMYPPLRSSSDRNELRLALSSGLIDAVATDHAPHSAFETEVPFEEAPRGVIGLETSAAAVLTYCQLDQASFFDRLSVAPARIGQIARQGRLVAPGEPANLTVIAPTEEWTVNAFRSKAENSPFRSLTLTGRVRATVFEGRLVHALVS
ncbi:MAG TPA: dihydroorotase [Acidimicrobiia bacterium]|nr:dihydroorotase [Acidimicrobiia bacterium]